MVDANGFLRGRGGGIDTVNLIRIHGQRFFYQGVAAHVERSNRKLCMSVRRSKNVNYIHSIGNHSFHRGKYVRNTEPSSQGRGARGYKISDANNPCIWNSLYSAGVKLADVAGSNQADPKICVYRHSDFPSKLVGIAIELFHLGELPSRTFAAS